MTVATRFLIALFVLWVGAAGPAGAAAQPPEPPEGFVSVDELPPQDQLPAAPLLISAYVFVVAVLFVYLMSLSRRLGAVQKEMDRLESDLKQRRS